MANFSLRSEEKLATCHPDIQQICRFVIQAFDYTILCGWRGEKEQNAAYPKYTTLRYPLSKHNYMKNMMPCSLAIDVIPYDPVKKRIIEWTAEKEFYLMAGHFKMAAYALGVEIRWGGNFNKFRDLPHIELINLT